MSKSKSVLLAALQPVITTVDIEGLGPVNFRQITVAENDAIRAATPKDAPASDFGVRLVAVALVDENGARVFQEGDLDSLRACSGVKLDTLVAKVLESNGYKRSDEAKNSKSSEATTSADSGSV